METKLDWSEYNEQGMGDAYADIPKHGGDFAKAVAVCIRSKHCEQNTHGLMCPSFRISGDVQQSPGGRVQLLKEYLNHFEFKKRPNSELEQAMDSCVACKGCKRECEVGLDMAQIKAELLAQNLQWQALTLRQRLFAYLPQLLYKHRWLRLAIKLRNRSTVIKKLLEKYVGITASLNLPVPSAKIFAPERKVFYPYRTQADRPHRSVVLLVDPYTALFNPQQAYDAIHVLRSAGIIVWPIHPLSKEGKLLEPGRNLYSQGLIEETQEQAQELLQALKVHLHFERPILGLEPSSLLMLRDEFLSLGLEGESAQLAKQAAGQAMLFEEYLAKESRSPYFDLQWKPQSQAEKLLVHGHCHQKSVGAMKAMRRILKLIPELNFEFIDSSCCGMAGTFGLEAEHAQQAKAMAELSLLPRIEQEPEACIMNNGFACSYQISQLSGRQPVHLVTYLARCIAEPVG